MPKTQSKPTAAQANEKGCGCGSDREHEHVQAAKSPTGTRGPSTHDEDIQVAHSPHQPGCCCGDKRIG